MQPVKKVFPFAGLMAFCNGVCFYMTDLLASRMNAAAQFTVVTCASILLSLTVAFLFQGDRFTKKSLIASICCIIAVGCQMISML
jgi:drug/metabolite transporter (DMT)-like permease